MVALVDSVLVKRASSLIKEKDSTSTPPHLYWIGGQLINSTWMWSDENETLIEWTNWRRSEPNNHGNGEDKIAINKVGLWNDCPSSEKLPFICSAKIEEGNQSFIMTSY